MKVIFNLKRRPSPGSDPWVEMPAFTRLLGDNILREPRQHGFREERILEDNGRKARFLVCVDCGEEFVFTASAQDYFDEKGYALSPKRCKVCHSKHKRGTHGSVTAQR